jgi:hypothetical protein
MIDNTRADSSPMPPAATELWGVKTRSAYITAEEYAQVAIIRLNGHSNLATV